VSYDTKAVHRKTTGIKELIKAYRKIELKKQVSSKMDHEDEDAVDDDDVLLFFKMMRKG